MAFALAIGIEWLLMNKNGLGTIGDLEKGHGAEGVRVTSASDLLPLLKEEIASGKSTVLDVPMINNPKSRLC